MDISKFKLRPLSSFSHAWQEWGRVTAWHEKIVHRLEFWGRLRCRVWPEFFCTSSKHGNYVKNENKIDYILIFLKNNIKFELIGKLKHLKSLF